MQPKKLRILCDKDDILWILQSNVFYDGFISKSNDIIVLR